MANSNDAPIHVMMAIDAPTLIQRNLGCFTLGVAW